MKKLLIIFIAIGVFNAASSQQAYDTSKKKLPYAKYKGQQLVCLSLTGFVFVETSAFDNTFNISLHPRYGYYFSPKFEGVAEYAFSFVKYGSLSPTRYNDFHQFAVTGRYFPLRKLNFIYAEAGLQGGTYTARKSDRVLIDKWSNNWVLGTGFEILPKKMKYVVEFNVRYVVPFNPNYTFDFVRQIGFGFVIKK
jgi:hypothetical protein